MSAVSFNLANFNRGMSQTSSRSKGSNNGSLSKTTSAQGTLHQKRNSNQKLEPIGSRAVTKNETKPVENKEKTLTQTVSTQQLGQGKTEIVGYIPNLPESSVKIRTVSEDIKKAYLSNPNVAIDNEAEYYEIVRSMSNFLAKSL